MPWFRQHFEVLEQLLSVVWKLKTIKHPFSANLRPCMRFDHMVRRKLGAQLLRKKGELFLTTLLLKLMIASLYMPLQLRVSQQINKIAINGKTKKKRKKGKIMLLFPYCKFYNLLCLAAQDGALKILIKQNYT